MQNTPYTAHTPQQIQKASFDFISQTLKQKGIVLPKEQISITVRVIHATADFDFAATLKYSSDVVPYAIKLLKNKRPLIITDTNMAKMGINKHLTKKLKIKVLCFTAKKQIAKQAKKQNTTRAATVIKFIAKKANKHFLSKMSFTRPLTRPLIFAIGNAPTALQELLNLYNQKKLFPALVIGIPVGFVNVAQSKKALIKSDLHYITNKGNKGGTPACVAICNALLQQATQDKKDAT